MSTHNSMIKSEKKNPQIFVFLSYLKDFEGTEKKSSNHPR